jgi:hypothetical protein
MDDGDGAAAVSSAHSGGGGEEVLTVTKTVSNIASQLWAGTKISSPSTGDYMEITWIKLEEGSVGTTWLVPDPAEEEARCKRYGLETIGAATSVVGVGEAYAATDALIAIPEPFLRRSSIAMTTSGNLELYSPALGSQVAVTGLAYTSISESQTKVYLNASVAAGLTVSAEYLLRAASDATARVFLDDEI